MLKKSPLAPKVFPSLPNIKGVRLATASCDIKTSKRDDVLLVNLDPGSTAAGVFTKSKLAAESVHWSKGVLKRGNPRAIIVNSGNANAFTGDSGKKSVRDLASSTSKVVGCHPKQVFVAQTGVIGEEFLAKKVTEKLPNIIKNMNSDWKSAAKAICTTDTFIKGVGTKVKVNNKSVLINGIAKGSGMIAPNMATMLAFIFTDAAIPSTILQSLLSEVNELTFNSITVDSDTSTNDLVLLCASGRANNLVKKSRAVSQFDSFQDGLHSVMLDLSHQIVKDGEGATKFVEVNVSGAKNYTIAKGFAFSVANSPLVKTAIFGEDANWGRLVMALGKCGQELNAKKITISIGGVEVAKNGTAVFNYNERAVSKHMKGQNINIEISIGEQAGSATVWTCDLTSGYIAINADYRT